MKSSLVFLALFFCLASAGYVQMTQDQIDQDSLCQSALNYGFNQVVEQATSSSQIASSQYQMSTVKSVYQEISTMSTNYKFTIQFSSISGSSYQADYTVSSSIFGALSLETYKTKKVSSSSSSSSSSSTTTKSSSSSSNWSSSTKTTTTIKTGSTSYSDKYVKLTSSQIQEQECQSAMQYGISQVMQIGLKAGKIKQNGYQVSKVNTVEKKVQKSGSYYKYDLYLTRDNSEMTCTFTILVSTSSFSMTSYKYSVKTTTVITDKQGTYVALSATQIQDQQCQSAMQYGINQVMQIGLDAGKIKLSGYQVSKINSVQQNVQSTGCYYKYDITMQTTNSVLTTTFTIYVSFSSQSFKMTAYKYKVETTKYITTTTTTNTNTVKTTSSTSYSKVSTSSFYASQTMQNCLQYAMQQTLQSYSSYFISEIVSIAEQTTSFGTSYKFNVNLADKSGKKVNLNCAVLNSNTGKLSVTAYSYKSSYSSNFSYSSTTKSSTSSSTTSNTSNTSSNSNSGSTESSNNNEGPEYEENYNTGCASDNCGGDNTEETYETDNNYEENYNTGCNSNDCGGSNTEETYETHIEEDTNNDNSNYEENYNTGCDYDNCGGSNTEDNSNYEESYITGCNFDSCDYTPEDNNPGYHTEVSPDGNSAYEYYIADDNYGEDVNINYNSESNTGFGSDYGSNYVESGNDDGSNNDDGSSFEDEVILTLPTPAYEEDFNSNNEQNMSHESNTEASSSGSSSSTTVISTSSSTSMVYTQVETSEIESSSTYNGLLEYGVQECLQDLFANNIITDMNYQVSQIMSSYTYQANNQDNCFFQVQLVNSFESKITVHFVVSYSQETKVKSLISYFLESMSAQDTSSVVVADYSNTDGGQIDMGTCNVLNSEQIQGEDCQQAIQYGITQINQQLSMSSKSSIQTDFSLSDVQNVYQDVLNAYNYRVVATLVNSAGVKADCSFSVNHGGSAGGDNEDSMDDNLNSYSYVLY